MRLSGLTTLLAVVGMTGVANARVIVEDFSGHHPHPELNLDFGTGTDYWGSNPSDDHFFDFLGGNSALWLRPDLVTVTVTSLTAGEYIESVEIEWTDHEGQGNTIMTAYSAFSVFLSTSVTHPNPFGYSIDSLSTLDLGGDNIGFFTIESPEVQIHSLTITILPSPSSVALLGFGGLIAVRRRR